MTARAAQTGDAWTPTAFPVEFLSLGGIGPGVPVRATMTGFGPVLLSKVLDLNPTQESSLGLIFHYADGAGLPLLDLKDLRSVMSWLISDEGKPELKSLGGLSPATAGVILRDLIGLEELGGDVFFGEPEWEPADILRTTPDGRGVISAVELTAVQDRPALFSTFLMWLLAELFEELPEVGDVDKPKLVFFFDEAHLLFDGASKAFLDSVTQTVRLIRSKGVGIFFVTQNPTDVPERRARPAGQPGAARAAHVHARGRQGPAQDGVHVPGDRRLRPRRTAHVAGHRRGGGDRPVRARVADAGRLDDAAGAPVPDGAGRAGGDERPRVGVAAEGEVRAGRSTATPPTSVSPPGSPRADPRTGSRVDVPSPAPPSRTAPGPARTAPDEGGVVGQVLGSAAFRSFARSAASALGREITRGLFGNRRR